MTSARNRLWSRSGQSLAEYAVLLALMAGGLGFVLVGISSHVKNIYTTGNDTLASAECGTNGGSGVQADGSGAGGSCSNIAGGGGGGGTTSGGGGSQGGGGGGGSSSGGGGGSSSGGGGGSSSGGGGSSGSGGKP